MVEDNGADDSGVPCEDSDAARQYDYIPIERGRPLQHIFREINFTQPQWTLYEFCLVPNRDYTQLWFNCEDDDLDLRDGQPDFEEWRTFQIGDLSISCCDDRIVYNSTEKAPFPGDRRKQHDPLPVISHATTSIEAIANNGDIIIKEDENVAFRAGSFIEIEPVGNNAFIVEGNGSNFSAEIEPCNCTSPAHEVCINYLPPGTNPNTENEEGFDHFFFPEVFNPNSPNEPNRFFSIIYGSQYIMPYNATYVNFEVYAEPGNLVHQQIIDNACEGIEPGVLFWDGCFDGQPLNSNVYAWVLRIRNCYGTFVESGDVTLASNSAANCPSRSVDNTSGSILPEAFYRIDKRFDFDLPVNIYPNPIHNEFTLEYLVQQESAISLTIQNSQGRTIQKLVGNQLQRRGIKTLNVNLTEQAAGIYFVHLKIDQQTYSRKIIKQ